jgi:hypothetical protein
LFLKNFSCWLGFDDTKSSHNHFGWRRVIRDDFERSAPRFGTLG